MNKYNPEKECPKCGFTNVSERFVRTISGPGKIERKCARCTYIWDEKTLDDNSLNTKK